MGTSESVPEQAINRSLKEIIHQLDWKYSAITRNIGAAGQEQFAGEGGVAVA